MILNHFRTSSLFCGCAHLNRLDTLTNTKQTNTREMKCSEWTTRKHKIENNVNETAVGMHRRNSLEHITSLIMLTFCACWKFVRRKIRFSFRCAHETQILALIEWHLNKAVSAYVRGQVTPGFAARKLAILIFRTPSFRQNSCMLYSRHGHVAQEKRRWSEMPKTNPRAFCFRFRFEYIEQYYS